MNRCRLVNRSTGHVLAHRAEVARGAAAKFFGLMGKSVPPDYALGFLSCDWVHTWGMRVPLDIVFCQSAGQVLRVFLNVPPLRVLPRVRGASVAWEMAGGQLKSELISPGDLVVFE